jgi:hypothetical protein
MKNQALQMVLDVMNDGSRIDRYLSVFEGKFYLSDDSSDGVKIPVFFDIEPTEEDAQHFIDIASK